MGAGALCAGREGRDGGGLRACRGSGGDHKGADQYCRKAEPQEGTGDPGEKGMDAQAQSQYDILPDIKILHAVLQISLFLKGLEQHADADAREDHAGKDMDPENASLSLQLKPQDPAAGFVSGKRSTQLDCAPDQGHYGRSCIGTDQIRSPLDHDPVDAECKSYKDYY